MQLALRPSPVRKYPLLRAREPVAVGRRYSLRAITEAGQEECDCPQAHELGKPYHPFGVRLVIQGVAFHEPAEKPRPITERSIAECPQGAGNIPGEPVTAAVVKINNADSIAVEHEIGALEVSVDGPVVGRLNRGRPQPGNELVTLSKDPRRNSDANVGARGEVVVEPVWTRRIGREYELTREPMHLGHRRAPQPKEPGADVAGEILEMAAQKPLEKCRMHRGPTRSCDHEHLVAVRRAAPARDVHPARCEMIDEGQLSLDLGEGAMALAGQPQHVTLSGSPYVPRAGQPGVKQRDLRGPCVPQARDAERSRGGDDGSMSDHGPTLRQGSSTSRLICPWESFAGITAPYTTTLRELRMKKTAWADLALWIPTLFLVYVFARQGTAKFSDASGWARAFVVWHFPVWFRILIGILETSAALLLLLRRTAPIGAAIIATVMLGGMGTHIYWGQPGQVTSEMFPLMLSLIVLAGRWRHFASMVSEWRRPKTA